MRLYEAARYAATTLVAGFVAFVDD